MPTEFITGRVRVHRVGALATGRAALTLILILILTITHRVGALAISRVAQGPEHDEEHGKPSQGAHPHLMRIGNRVSPARGE